MEDSITLLPNPNPFDSKGLESEFAARDECVRYPGDLFGASWAFIVHPSRESREWILRCLQQDPRSGVMGGIIGAYPRGSLKLSLAYANRETLILMRDITQRLMDEYQPRVLDSLGVDRTEEAAGRADIFFPPGLGQEPAAS